MRRSGKVLKVGDKIGSLEIISDRLGDSKYFKRLCRCECGKELIKYESDLLGRRNRKSTRSCKDCVVKERLKDCNLIGKTCKNWKIKEYCGIYKHKVMYLCSCTTCGNTQSMSSTILKCEKPDLCKICKITVQESRFKDAVYRHICNGAKERELEVTVSSEYIYNLPEKQNYKCALSGESICLSKNIKDHNLGLTTASLDRIDSTKGYIEGNVQWVHKFLNMLKMHYKQEVFLDWCNKVSYHQRMLHLFDNA